MTELIEEPQTAVRAVPVEREHNPLYRALAWVGIAAGSLFIVGSVFFGGYVLGQQSGGGPQSPHHMMLRPPPPDGPMMGPGGPMGPPDGRMGPPDGGPRGEQLPPSPQPPSGSPRS